MWVQFLVRVIFLGGGLDFFDRRSINITMHFSNVYMLSIFMTKLEQIAYHRPSKQYNNYYFA